MGDVLSGIAAEGTTKVPLSTAVKAVPTAPEAPAPAAAPAPEPPPPPPPPPPAPEPPAPHPPAAAAPPKAAPEPPAAESPAAAAPHPAAAESPAAAAPHPAAPEPPAPHPTAPDPPHLPAVEAPHVAVPHVSVSDVAAATAKAADTQAAHVPDVSLPHASDLQTPDPAPAALADSVAATAGHASDTVAGLTAHTAPIAEPLAGAAAPVDDVLAGAAAPVDDVVHALSDTAVAASPLTDTLTDPGLLTPDGLAGVVSDPLTDPGLLTPDGLAGVVSDPLRELSVAAPVGDVVHAVADTAAVASPLTDTLTDTLSDPGLVAPVDGIVAPLTNSVIAVPPALGDGVDALVAPLTTTVGETAGALAGAVPSALSVDPFTLPVVPGSASAGPAPLDSASPASMHAVHVSDTAPQQALADGAATTAAPAAAVPDLASLGHQGALNVDGIDLTGGLDGSAVAPLSDPFAGADPLAAAPADLPPFDGAPVGGADVSALPVAPPGMASDSVLGVVTQVGQDTRIVAAAAVMTFAAASLIGPRAGGSGADARMAFTNVRLLPCLVKDAAGRQLSAITQGLAPAAAPAYAALSERAASAGSHIVREAGAVKAEHAEGFMPHIVSELTEGFARATRDAPGEAADGLSDSRLVVQLGMLFGIVYLAFLSVWFWATRTRASSRA